MCEPRPLIACGIFARELRHLIEARGWRVAPCFLSSALHVDLQALGDALSARLVERPGAAVLYGACHPCMEALLEPQGAARVEGQNCVELLIGAEAFERHLSAGAFFLLEEWARRWEAVTRPLFGSDEITREIFRQEHTHLLALRTPCSGDFRERAEVIAARVGLPLRWLDVGLEHLEGRVSALLEPR